jgi:hypothetical protein
MRRTAVRAAACALVAGAALIPAVASAQSSAPALRVHAIFTGDSAERSTYHVGEALFSDVQRAGGRKLTQVCFSSAPIARPACSAAPIAAPAQPGPLTITATLDDGTKLTRNLNVIPPATHVGGRRMVPATITCQDVGLYGNYDQRRHRSRDLFETMTRGTRVAMLNRIAPGKIFMWDYATNRGGFASEACAEPNAV